jgi:hypothetical protein
MITFFHGKSDLLIVTKSGLGHIYIGRTHLVTLILPNPCGGMIVPQYLRAQIRSPIRVVPLHMSRVGSRVARWFVFKIWVNFGGP